MSENIKFVILLTIAAMLLVTGLNPTSTNYLRQQMTNSADYLRQQVTSNADGVIVGTQKSAKQEGSVPDLGGYVVLANMGANKVVTLYGEARIVCIEHGKKYARDGALTAFACWDIDVAPKRIQELVNAHNKPNFSGCGISAC